LRDVTLQVESAQIDEDEAPDASLEDVKIEATSQRVIAMTGGSGAIRER
jgi:hypothetical protein